MRNLLVAIVVVSGCGGEARAPSASAGSGSGIGGGPVTRVMAGTVSAQSFADLTSALRTIVPADARAIGFGELHARVDRAPVKSALAAFTEVLPTFAPQVSDLVVETWIVDSTCGKAATTATAAMETAVKRPAATKSEIALLADAARAGQVQPHAMTLACSDYATIAPAGGEVDPVAMLTITTRELGRVAASAISFRDAARSTDAGVHRAWIAIYGGALHNDRFPAAGVAEWSYADSLDLATDGHYVEVDLIVRGLADLDAGSQHQPWFPLLAEAPGRVLVWERGERSFVVLLPRDAPAR